MQDNDLIYSENDKKCAPNIDFIDGSCISLDILIAMANAYNSENSNKIKMYPSYETLSRSKYKKYLVRSFKDRLSNVCSTQKCWTEQKFNKKLSKMQYNLLKHKTFRPEGPISGNKWLNTNNINNAMKQYENKYRDFVFLGAVPINFDDIYSDIKNLDFDMLVQNNKIHIGIIFNLDESWKSGSHWVAAYANLQTGQIYYFDSYGAPPEHRIRKLLRRISTYCSKRLNKTVEASHNKIRHQYGGSECGVYSMNFILRLLRGETFTQICESKTPDKQVNQCRRVYFSKG